MRFLRWRPIEKFAESDSVQAFAGGWSLCCNLLIATIVALHGLGVINLASHS